MRYFRQPDKYSCGPTAIANALVWAGVDVKLRNILPLLRFSCQTIDFEFPNDWDANGTYDRHFDRTLRYASKGRLAVRCPRKFSLESIKRHLLAGGAICLGYYWKESEEQGEHFVFIPEMKGDKFLFVNDHNCYRGRITRRRSIKKMREYLTKQGPNGSPPVVWFLTRKAAITE